MQEAPVCCVWAEAAPGRRRRRWAASCAGKEVLKVKVLKVGRPVVCVLLISAPPSLGGFPL
jgi:hypothetical protein